MATDIQPLLSVGANVFDGTADSTVVLPHDAAYVLDQGTFELSFTADTVTSRRTLFSKDSSGFDDGGHITTYVENGDLVVRLQSTNETHVITVPDAITAGQQYHMAITFGPEGMALYLDGALVGQNAYTGGLLVNEEPLVIGANQWASGDLVADTLSDFFDGEIGTFNLYGQQMTATEVAALADKPPPVATDDTAQTNEDTAVSIAVLANDSDPEGGSLTLIGVDDPANGTAVIDDGGTLDPADDVVVYTPDADFNGSDSFTYTIRNSAGGVASASVSVTVDPLPDAPVARNDSYIVGAGGGLSVDAAAGVLANDSDADGDPLSVALASGPAKGTVALAADGGFTYTPDATFDGRDSFTYTLSDGTGRSDTATVYLSEIEVAPRIVTGEETFQRITVDSNLPLNHVAVSADFDGDGDIDLVGTSEGSDTVAWFENDGALTFTRHDIDTALESAYPASASDLDQDGDMDILAAGYRADLYVWYENDGAGGFTRHEIASLAGPHSIFAVDMDGDGDNDILAGTQDLDRISWFENDGAQNFTERVIDTTADGAKTAVAADVDGDGDLDVVTASYFDATVAWYENDGSQSFTKRIITTTADGAYYAETGDLDGDGDLDIVSASQIDDTIAWYRNDGGGVFTEQFIDLAADAARSVHVSDVDRDGDLDVLAGSVNDSTVAWHENDGSGAFTKHVVGQVAGAYGVGATDMDQDGLIDVLSAGRDDGSINVHKQVKAHAVQVEAGAALSISTSVLQAVDENDTAADLTWTLVTAPTGGSLQRDGVALAVGDTFTQADIDQGLIAYVDDATTGGGDSFALALSDTGGGIAPASAVFDVQVTAGTPLAADDTAETTEDLAVAIDVLANDTDTGGGSLTLTNAGAPANGTAAIDDRGTSDPSDDVVVYTPDADFSGSDSFDYTVRNSGGATASATVSVTVSPVPDAPVAADDGYTVQAGSTLTVDAASGVLANDTDADGDPLTATLATAPAKGALSLAADGSFTYTPGAAFDGQDSFTYTASDGTGLQDTATVTLAAELGPLPLLSEGPHIFDGSAATAVTLPHDTAYLLEQGTFALSFTFDTVSDRRTLFSKDSSGFDDGGHITAFVENGALVVRLQSTNKTYVVEAPGVVSAGVAHHMALTFGPDGMTLYLDGAAVDLDPYAGGLLGNQEPLVIGANQWASGDLVADKLSDFFVGEIGSFDLYAEALTAAEVAALAETAAPVAADDTATVDEDAAVSIAVLANDSDADGGSLSIAAVETPAHGTAVVDDLGTADTADDVIVYTPDPDYAGLDSFVYTVVNDAGVAATATVTVDVAPQPDAPVALDDAYAVLTGQTLAVGAAQGVLANDSDVDGDVLSALLATAPAKGTLSLAGDGSFTYTPDATFDGQDSFTYTAVDGTGLGDTATVTLTADTGPVPILSQGPTVFDGTEASAVILPHDDLYLLEQGTFEVAFTADTVGGRNTLFSKDSRGFDDGGHVTVFVENGSLVARLQSTNKTHVVEVPGLTAGQSYHMALTFGSDGMALYLDGVAVDTDPYTGGLLVNEEPLAIGANQWASGDLVADKLSDFFDGEMSTVALYDQALTSTEIADLATDSGETLIA